MKNLLLAPLLLIICSCACLKNELKKDLKNIDIIQNGKTWHLGAGEHELELSTAPFRFIFLQRPYNASKKAFHSVQVSASQNVELYNSISVGKKLEEIECFSPGTGIAMVDGDNTDMMVGDYGHHYLYYMNESERRLTKLGEKSGYYYLEWMVETIGDGSLIKDENGAALLYISIVIDRNRNTVIDAGELWKLKLLVTE